MANLIIIFLSLFLFVGVFLFCKVQWSRLNIIHLYLIFVGLYFGLYSFIKAFLKDYSQENPLAIALVFGQIIIILLVIMFISKLINNKMSDHLEIRYLIKQWSKVNSYAIYLLIVVIVLAKIIGYYQFSVISHVDQTRLTGIGKGIPYWYFAFSALITDLAFCAFIATMVKVVTVKNQEKLLWSILLLVLILLDSLGGRRIFVNLAIVGSIIWVVSQQKNLFKLKYLSLFAILFLSFFLFSNIYQSYRQNLELPNMAQSVEFYNLPKEKYIPKTKRLLISILDLQSTVNNIKMRLATWEFNYLIVNSQLNNERRLPYGSLIGQGLKNSIPRFLWPEKEIRSLNDITANLYGLPLTDYNKNNFAFTQADFGLYSIIVMPLAALIILLFMFVIIRSAVNHSTLLLICTGFIINYLINIEQDYVDIFILFRHVIMIICLFIMGQIIINIYHYLKGFLGHKFSLTHD